VSVVATRPTRELVPIGQYPARCIDVYDAGFWPGLEAGHVHKVKVVFYLGQDSKTGRHLYIELFERLSLGEKANLTKYLTSWRGKPFTAEELKGFDLERLVNAPALIQVAHKAKRDGSDRDYIAAVMGLPKGLTAPATPADYKRDKDRPEQFASRYPDPYAKSASSPARTESEGDFPGALADEDDDLPF
jgi:hypothetical protein